MKLQQKLFSFLLFSCTLKGSMRKQAPINSKFNASSTASEVVNGLPLRGKTAIITGGHSGLGFESTKALSVSGVNVIVGARNVIVAQEKLVDMPNVVIKHLDLSDLESVKKFSDDLISSEIQVDMLICNAGIMACPENRVGLGRWESQFATNHLGHYALTNQVWKALNPGARIVCVSSAGHHSSPIRWDDIHFEHGYDKWMAYGQSKTANILFALQLDEYGKEHNIRAFSLHPGKIFTPLQRHLEITEMIEAGWLDADGYPADPTFKTPEQGAATQLWAATSPMLEGLGGVYCEDCEVTKLASEYSEPFRGVCAYAIDPILAQKFWDISAELTGVNAFSSN